jgi:formamidopyrimidine-DNA glycosylase
VPELPDITVYVEALASRILHERLNAVRVLNPFVLRTVHPPISEANGREVVLLRRLGKRIVIGRDGDLFVLIHLMIAGRLRWLPVGKAPPRKLGLAALEFANGTLVLAEAGTTRRASMSLVRGSGALGQMDRGCLDVFAIDAQAFVVRLRSENHTLKRALTDPRLFDGIGNAYSDEILHRAKLSPISLTGRITDADATTLYHAARTVLSEWVDRLRTEAGEKFPERVTAFRPEMAVHGKYRQPCPVCGTPVQRIRYATNETDYCARCQTGGRLLADRALSRLLKKDWPRSVDDI